MANNYITNDELKQFRSLSKKKIVDSMEAYLIGVNGQKYNMQEVGAMVFGSENYSFTVSLIHRCYNFSGQNGAKYRRGCKFEQTYGYTVTRKDIENFVRKYPNGTFAQGIIFDDFLKTRINLPAAKPQNQNVQRRIPPVQQAYTPQYNPTNDRYIDKENNQPNNATLRLMVIVQGSIGVLILLILLVTGGLFRHWIISLIMLFFSLGSFSMLNDYK